MKVISLTSHAVSTIYPLQQFNKRVVYTNMRNRARRSWRRYKIQTARCPGRRIIEFTRAEEERHIKTRQEEQDDDDEEQE